MDLTENFTLKELIYSSTAQRLQISNYPDAQEMENLKKLCKEILQPIRNKLKLPITVTSGYRNSLLNKVLGGAKNSQHISGEAADILCADNYKLWSLINQMIKSGEIVVGQLINEKNLSWIHISLPTGKHNNQILTIN